MRCSRLHNNQLTGTLPPSWGTNSSMPHLRVASLQGNKLSGERAVQTGQLCTRSCSIQAGATAHMPHSAFPKSVY